MEEKQQSVEGVQKMISDKVITAETLEETGKVWIDNKLVNNSAVGLAVFSFGFLSIGSFLFGATATTAILRGVGGGVLFGALLWLTGTMLIQKENPLSETILKGEVNKGLESTPIKDKPT